MIIDATFFGREYGYLCFHDGQQIVYAKEIKTETVAELVSGILELKRAGYRFASFTVDGKKGFIRALKRLFPAVPVQMCQFHQQAIIQRYITNKPKTFCGQELKELMKRFCKNDAQKWIDDFYALQERYEGFLSERNENGDFMHGRLRSAFRSIRTNLPYLFVHQEITSTIIPHTTNRIEGCFSHLKEKIKLHRGLRLDRKKKAILFILYMS